ncbi:MAG: filamentation protein [Coxiella sp. (in: Bacteria)]|nr:MAG: filamentation protein [Coxiella sp. (in: g-proteobacteria)]
MEPMLPAEGVSPQAADLAVELMAKASALETRLNPVVANSISNLVRSMNCYYSNLIEGHNTHPRDIEKALENDFSKDSNKRELQLEAKAHIAVQSLIDNNQMTFSFSTEYLLGLHEDFCAQLPDALLCVPNPDSGEIVQVQPGAFRQQWIQVGRYIAPGPDDIPMFLDCFEEAYNSDHLTKVQRIIAVGASHHRFLWIHPFLDGNGGVVRLFSHAFLRELGICSGLWSIARGLARNATSYKAALADADSPRRGDFDGRGALSARGLEDFCTFFLNTCLDQVLYMDTLIEPTELMRRIALYVEDEQSKGNLPKGSLAVLKEAFFSGEIARGQIATITGYKERQARTVLNTLLKNKLLMSDTPRGPVRLNFPLDVVERWLPQLYPL